MVIVKPHAVVLVMLANAAMLAAVPAEAQNRDALRQIVQEGCAPHWLQAHDPAPCERGYLPDARHDGYAVLADRKGGAHFLLIPTRRISGPDCRSAIQCSPTGAPAASISSSTT